MCVLACLMVSSAAPGADSPSFSRDIVPVLKTRCASCHLTGEEAGEIALYPEVAWSNLVDIASVQSELKRVKPGTPGSSYLLLKLEGQHLDAGGTGSRMPFNAEPLSDKVLAQIRAWIESGAQNI